MISILTCGSKNLLTPVHNIILTKPSLSQLCVHKLTRIHIGGNIGTYIYYIHQAHSMYLRRRHVKY